MTVEELESEVVLARADRDKAEAERDRLRDVERTLTHRNVALFERQRFIDKALRDFHTQIGEILATGAGRE